MQIPLEITFRDMPHLAAVEAEIREKAAGLEHLFGKLTSCRVVVEAPHRSHEKGQIYTVRIDITLPGREIVVNREVSRDERHDDIHVAVRDAFKRAQRQLRDHVRSHRGEVKHHEVPPHGRISSLFGDYGFIATPDGREVYFHRNAVCDGFDGLEVGTEVRFAEEPGEKGPQATTVHIAGRHHHL